LKVDNKNFETTNCIVCDVDDTHKVSEQGQFGIPAHVVICRRCGLTYLNPRWNKERLTHFYEKEYDNFYRPSMNADAAQSLYIPMYERLKSQNFKLENMEHILDIGSGEGNNLKYIIDQLPNARFYAIEPSPTCRTALQALNVNILGTDAEEEFAPKFHGYFDLIIMRHVLEHFANPIEIIKKVKPLLKEDGILYIAVPNSLNFGKHKLLDHCFRSVHTYYFSVHTIQNIFRKSGVDVVWIAEGDSYNLMELFAVVKNGDYKKANIDQKYYTIQKASFEQKLKKEKSTIGRLKSWWKNNRSIN